MNLVIPGSPKPKQRPRFTRQGRVYSPSSKEERRVAEHIAAQIGYRKPLTGPLKVTMRFYRSDKRRVDLDNLEKLVADSANGVLWVDDSQIMEVTSSKHYDKDNPRTEVTVERGE